MIEKPIQLAIANFFKHPIGLSLLANAKGRPKAAFSDHRITRSPDTLLRFPQLFP